MHNQIQSNPPFDTAFYTPFPFVYKYPSVGLLKSTFLSMQEKANRMKPPCRQKVHKETEQWRKTLPTSSSGVRHQPITTNPLRQPPPTKQNRIRWTTHRMAWLSVKCHKKIGTTLASQKLKCTSCWPCGSSHTTHHHSSQLSTPNHQQPPNAPNEAPPTIHCPIHRSPHSPITTRSIFAHLSKAPCCVCVCAACRRRKYHNVGVFVTIWPIYVVLVEHYWFKCNL